MDKNIAKNLKKYRRQKRVRSIISGTGKRPRLSVFKSNKGMYAQLIDDQKGITVVSVHSKEVKASKSREMGAKTAVAFEIGRSIAKKAQEKKISEIIFDRSGYKYHGRIKAVADGAREGGLSF